MSKIVQQCPLCSERYYIELTNAEDSGVWAWRNGEYIQNALPSLNATEREFLMTGYCPHCQESIFDNGETDRIKQVKEKAYVR